MEGESVHFSSTEIVELGVQIEKNGRDFYNDLARKFKDLHIKEFFTQMSREEEQHIEDFKRILSSVQNYEPGESYPEEYFSYIRAVAGEYVFTKSDKAGERTKVIANEKEAINVCIGLEKDSILFYTEMKRMLQENEHKIVDNVIAQEKEHVRKLWSLRSSL